MNNFKKATKKPVTINYLTFDELVQYGAKVAPEDAELHEGFAWAFEFNGYAITHESNKCYLIQTLEGIHNMTPNDVLIIGIKGEIYPCKIDIFELTYDKIID